MSVEKKRKPSSEARKPKKGTTKRQKTFRNRMMIFIAVVVVAAVAVALLVCKMTGVFDKRAEVSTITIKEDGTIICEEVTDFEENFYDKAGLKKFMKSQINNYNTSVGSKQIKFDRLKVDEKTAYAKTTYKTAKDYSAFTGIEMFSGKMKTAKKTYEFADNFVAVKKGKKDADASTLDIMSQKNLNVLIIRENCNVTVEGKIVYVSDSATTMVNENTVAIAQPDGNPDATQLTYIIYK